MDVFAIRQANLRALTASLTAERVKTQSAAAIELGLSGGSFLSQLLAGKKMGEDVARKIEQSMELPYGWMDQSHAASATALHERTGVSEVRGPYPAPSQPLRIDPHTIAAALKLIRLTYEMLGLEVDVEDDGLPVALAYEFLAQRADQSVTAENLVDFSKKLAERRGELLLEHTSTGSTRSTGSSDRSQGRRKAS